MRDLSLKKSLNESKGLTQARTSKLLLHSQNDFIEDITSTELMLVDDLAKVSQIIDLIASMNRSEASSRWQSLFSLVKSWPTLTAEKKNSNFGEFYSHELNFFIKKRDPAYFENIAKPFLMKKMEKTFVDKYLCDFWADLSQQYLKNPHTIQELNPFEKCLLIEVFCKEGKKDMA